MKNKLTVAFLLLTVAELIGTEFSIPVLQYIAKPLLVPVLMLLLALANTQAIGKNILLTGLFFSWAGDIFLMLNSKEPLYFMLGLACFLTTHIFYIAYFLRIRSNNPSLLKKLPILLLLVIAYGLSLIWLLFPYLGSLKLPVIVYAAVICTMLLCSLHVFLKVKSPSNIFYLLGAASFVLSDSLLAFNKFYQPFAFAGVCIMLTYCAAQYGIVKGAIEQRT